MCYSRAVSFWKRTPKPAPAPPPPKTCRGCATECAAATFTDPAFPDLCAACLERTELVRRCPTCEQRRAAGDFLPPGTTITDADLPIAVASDAQMRAGITRFLLQACRHCKRQCRVCKVSFPRISAFDEFFPAGGSLADVCAEHISECAFCKTWSLTAEAFTNGAPGLCDRCFSRAFPIEVQPALKTIFKIAKLDQDEETPAATTARSPGTAVIGTDTKRAPVALPLAVRNRHVYIIGRTGSGKTVTLKSLIRQDINDNFGVGFLDPHGDAAFDLLGHIPEARRGDVVYFCPTDPDCPSFNLLAFPYEPAKLTADIVSALKLFFAESWGFRMEQILTMALLTLIADRGHEPHSFADLKRLLVNDEYREPIVARLTNTQLAEFWRHEFPKLPKDATGPITNKLAQFLMPLSPMERIFSNPANDFDPFTIMNDGKILLCNLAKGELGESAAFLIGALLTTAVSQAALARTKIPERDRRDFMWYVDEFQNFAVASFESILSEARKYRLNLTLAHQYLDQVPSSLRAAIAGNVAVVVALPVSPNDANAMASLMGTTHHAYRDGTLFDLEEAVTTTARGWCEVATELLKPEARQFTNALSAHHFPHLVDEVLPVLAPDLRFSVAGADETPDRKLGVKPADDRMPPYLRLTHPQLLYQRMVDFAGNPHAYVIVPSDLRETRWPSPQDFLTLSPLSGFARIESATNVRQFSFQPPTDYPDVAAREDVLTRQRQRLEQTAAAEKNRPPIIAQEPRTRPETTQPPHPNATTSPTTTTPATSPSDDPDDFLT